MDQSLLRQFGTPEQRVEAALRALQQGQGVLVVMMRIARMKVI